MKKFDNELLEEQRDYFVTKYNSGKIYDGRTQQDYDDPTISDLLNDSPIFYDIKAVYKNEDDSIIVECLNCTIEFYN